MSQLGTATSQPDRALVTIVIVSWNALAPLRVCLDSIFASTWRNIEVIVCDNDSQDGTPDALRRAFPQVTLFRNAENIGHTKGVNQGIKAARGTYILVLDADTELAPDCIEVMVNYLDSHEGVGMVAPRTFNTDGTIQETARNFPSAFSGLFGRQSTLTRLLPNNPFSRAYLARAHFDATEPFQVQQIGGACMFFRRTVIERVGLWDERYFGYWVDTDWCRHLWHQGLAVFCVPSTYVYHHENNKRGKPLTLHRAWMFHHSAYIYYTKWHTYGRFDPRSVVAGILLAARAAAKVAQSNLRRPTVVGLQQADPARNSMTRVG